MFIEVPKCKRQSGIGILEQVVIAGLTSIVAVIMAGLFVSSTTQVSRTVSYCDMSAASQSAVDYLSRDIRKANRVGDYTTNILRLEDADGLTISYIYDPGQGTLTRTKGTQRQVLLQECESLAFTLSKRNSGGAFGNYPPATPAECKVISASWRCARALRGQKVAHENISTGQIVIRRQRR